MKLIFAPRAKLDLLEIWIFIAEDSIDAADRLREKIRETALQMAQFPESGRSREEISEGLRSFPVGNYILLYRPIEGGIDIVRIIHGARDLKSAFDN